MTTESSELPTAWPTVQTFAMDNTNDSTSAHDNGTDLAASLSPANDVCVAELFATGFALISSIGTIGNLLVITSLLVNKKLRTSLNAFITSMAMGDLIFAGVHEPLSAQALALGGLTYRPMLCTVLGAATVASASQSLIASTLIAINRFILIQYPYTVYKRVFKPCNTFFMIAASWTMSVLVVLPPLLGFGELGYNRASSICDFAVDNPSTFTYFMTIPGVLVFLSNGITVFCYLKIYQKVKQSAANAHRGPGPNNAGSRQVPGKVLNQTKHMFVMFVTFCVCTTPYSIFYTVDRDMALSPCLWQTLTFLFACNSSINPVIHTCRSRDYRNAFRHIVCCGRRRPARIAKARKITVEEKKADNPRKAHNRVEEAAPRPVGSPPSDTTDTSPLQQQRDSIAVTQVSGQPLSSHSGQPLSNHSGRLLSSHSGRPLSSHSGRLLSSHSGRPLSSHSGRLLSSHSERPLSSHSGRLLSNHSGQPLSSRSERPLSSRSGQPLSSHSGQPLSVHSGRSLSSHSRQPLSNHSGKQMSSHSGQPLSNPSGQLLSNHSGQQLSSHSSHSTGYKSGFQELPGVSV